MGVLTSLGDALVAVLAQERQHAGVARAEEHDGAAAEGVVVLCSGADPTRLRAALDEWSSRDFGAVVSFGLVAVVGTTIATVIGVARNGFPPPLRLAASRSSAVNFAGTPSGCRSIVFGFVVRLSTTTAPSSFRARSK